MNVATTDEVMTTILNTPQPGPRADRLLNKWAVDKQTSLDITTIYRKMKGGTFRNPFASGNAESPENQTSRRGSLVWRSELASDDYARRDSTECQSRAVRDRTARLLYRGGIDPSHPNVGTHIANVTAIAQQLRFQQAAVYQL